MKTACLGVLVALTFTSATAVNAAEPAGPTPSYVAVFSAPVNVLVGCYTNSRTLMTSTPTGDGFAIRRKGETSTLLLKDEGVRSRAELYRSADGPSRAMRQVLRSCDRRALSSTGSL